jgi:hypothetical protein
MGLAAADAPEFFEMRVRPLLAKNCYPCHSTAHLGGLELTSRENVLKGGNSGPAVVPNKPADSLLIQAVSHTHARLKMPPSGKLKDEEIQVLREWVGAGAIWPETQAAVQPAKTGPEYVIAPGQRAFWAFQLVRKPPVPVVRNKNWVQTPIDAFVLARLESKGLAPAPAADRRTWIRRVTFDLIGLPPDPEDVDAFQRDHSSDAFRKVVDRLLASPRYGERWGRYWLDVARYSDDRLNSTQDDPYPNSFRYRDWVIAAFNDDMPYDLFAKAQIAGDLFPSPQREKLVAGLGFYGLSPEFQDDRVDATTRAFLGLTAGCAQCHDHKFDPIPAKDYYSLLGVFESTKLYNYPLAPDDVVKNYDTRNKKIADQQTAIQEFLSTQSLQLAEIFASQTAKYLMAARQVIHGEDAFEAAREGRLDPETLSRMARYLQVKSKEHPYLKSWDALVAAKAPDDQLQKAAQEFRELLVAVNVEKKSIDEKNLIRLGGSQDRDVLSAANLLSLPRDKYILWRDFFSSEHIGDPYKFESGVFRYDEKKIERFLAGEWKAHLQSLRDDRDKFKHELPPPYPYLHTIRDNEKPANARVHIRGSADNLGDEVPRHFLSVLCDGPPPAFHEGSGRMELAAAIANRGNPLTARVMVNRIWQHHFGWGIVRTPSNFGRMGEPPTHPELLDYLAARFMQSSWSVKALHREILLSATYALSAAKLEKNFAADPDNRLLWRANRRRLDIEALRDSLLYVSGKLDGKVGGEAEPIAEEKNDRRTVYAFVSRRRLDPTLALFDFPNPNNTSDDRMATNTPLQRLFFLNSGFLMRQGEALSARVAKEAGGENASRIRRCYRLLLNRDPSPQELQLGLEFLRGGGKSWPEYAQMLLSANEFYFLN